VQAWKISRFAEVNKEWWVLLSLFVIAALLNSFGTVSPMLLFLYVLPTLFSAYFLGPRTSVSTALASIILVVLGLVLQHYVLMKDSAQAISDTTWYQLGVWSGILVLCAYATGTLFREMHESYSGYLLLLRYLLLRDDRSNERLRRVSLWSAMIADEMGMNRDEVEVIRTAALLRDLSQLSISPQVMKKATKLTSRVQLEQGNIYTDQELMKLRKVLPIVIAYLEKSDDRGVANKVIDIADEFDHLVHPEERRKAVQPDLALDMIARSAGERFDDKAVMAFEKLLKSGKVAKIEVSATVS
jgi:HD-GYP domain